MDCSLIQGDLISYHFATASEMERARVETHLVECTVCLRAYLALKAHVERVGDEEPREPSRLRLRAAVAERFRPTATRRLRSFFSKPVPLYQGLAVAAALVLVATVGPVLARQWGQRTIADITHRVDTSRTSAESLTIY